MCNIRHYSYSLSSRRMTRCLALSFSSSLLNRRSMQPLLSVNWYATSRIHYSTIQLLNREQPKHLSSILSHAYQRKTRQSSLKQQRASANYLMSLAPLSKSRWLSKYLCSLLKTLVSLYTSLPRYVSSTKFQPNNHGLSPFARVSSTRSLLIQTAQLLLSQSPLY